MSSDQHHSSPQPSQGATAHRARWVIVDSQHIIENGWVTVASGSIQSVAEGRRDVPANGVDHGEGVIMPSLVNAHTHLELSALRGKVPWSGGFGAWVKHLVNARENLEAADFENGINIGIEALLANGTGVVGEISTLGGSRDPFWRSPLGGVWFREMLGSARNFGQW